MCIQEVALSLKKVGDTCSTVSNTVGIVHFCCFN